MLIVTIMIYLGKGISFYLNDFGWQNLPKERQQ